MTVKESIEQKCERAFAPIACYVINESHQHNVPQPAETHFKLVIVSDAFKQKNRVQRHQEIYALLQNELQAGVHALSIFAHTQEEWDLKNHAVEDSPACRGGKSGET